MASTSEIKNGLCLDYNNDIYTVIEFLHVKTDKGQTFIKIKFKTLKNVKVIDNTWPSGHKIDIVRVERRKYQYLYPDDMGFNFMNTEEYTQIVINPDLIENANLLKEGSEVEILFHAEKETPLTIDMPAHIILEVTYTEPGVRGDTATNVTKPATVETGAEIRVPIFINEGDLVKIDTRTGAYMERVKN